MKILVVEDEAVLARVLQEKLVKSGYETKIAKDGEEALSLAHSFAPNLILLDLLLPKKSGFEVLETLKADQMLKTIPIVVISNLGEDTDIKRALSLGAADYYVKSEHPINEIVEKVKHILIESR